MNEESVTPESKEALEDQKTARPALLSSDATPETAAPPGPEWENELDVYPLKDPQDDPRWAVRTVWIWTGIAIASLIFIVILLILGAIYD